MSVRIRFQPAIATALVLAKVGNPQRDEPLQTSREVFRITEGDRPMLTSLFLKPFKNLPGYRFRHHSSLDQHEMNTCAAAIFASPEGLYQKGCDIAKRLYSKSTHPNIKSGDLCIAMIHDIDVNGAKTQGICILKSESVVPFLSIQTKDGDLQISTEHGINPEKIDKGCLILNHEEELGYYVMTFDRSGGDTRFWVREFLGVKPVTDDRFLTNTYAAMATNFLEEQREDAVDPEQVCVAARHAMDFFEERDQFDLGEFEREVLKTPESVVAFAEHRARVEEEQGAPLETSFPIEKKEVVKAKKKISAVMKLDTGIEVHLKSRFTDHYDAVLERGFDEAKGMKFVKVFYNQDLANPGE